MPPNSSGVVKPLLTLSMRRGGPPGAGTTTPLALQRSEFEDFANAYRPTLDVPRREPPEPPRPAEEPKADFGRSIKRLMKRPQGSPSTQSKNNKKGGFQRTPTVVAASSGQQERERSVNTELRPMSEKKTKRPLSANVETTLIPPQITIGPPCPVVVPPAVHVSQDKLDRNPLKPEAPIPPQQSPVMTPVPKNVKPAMKPVKNGQDDHLKVVQESAPAPHILTHVPPIPNPVQVKKKVSIQEVKRSSGSEVYSDAHCLIISGNNIGRFVPPRHNPDPILSMRVIPIPERKYHVIMEFEETPLPPKQPTSTSGMMVITPEDTSSFCAREQMQFFSWVRDSHVASMGMLLRNVERITEFPFVTYLVVGGGRLELSQKLHCIDGRPLQDSIRQLHFLAGYEETITISRPPLATFPEKPSSDKTGFVISLYQVLPGEDGVKFEQNWVMWTGARQIYRTVPEYMGLKRISVHKSILPTKVINYCLICEFSNIMDHLTDACVIIDHLRARCCGFTGIYRIMDYL